MKFNPLSRRRDAPSGARDAKLNRDVALETAPDS
jgi:hypothetical protein